MGNLRITDAIIQANKQGNNLLMRDIAEVLWPESSTAVRQVNMSRLVTGKLKYIKIDWIRIICDMTGVDANFLFKIK